MTIPGSSLLFLSSILSVARRERGSLLLGLLGTGLFFTATSGIKQVLLQHWRPLPHYTLLLSAGGSSLCCRDPATNAEPLRLRSDETLDIVLRPEQPTASLVFIHAFERHGEKVRTLHFNWDEDSQGQLRLRGLACDVLDLDQGDRGHYELVFAVDQSPLPLSYSRAQDQAAYDSSSARLQIIRGEVIVTKED